MPLVLDYEPILSRPIKRRRLVPETNMARRVEVDQVNPQEHEEHEEHEGLPHEARCEALKTLEQPISTPYTEVQTSDRDELIQCIKRGQRPTWVPRPSLRALCAEEEEALQGKEPVDREVNRPLPLENKTFQLEDELLFGSWNGSDEPVLPTRSAMQSSRLDEGDMSTPAISPTASRSTSLVVGDSVHRLSSSPPSWLEELSYSPIGRAVSAKQNKPAMTLGPSRPRAPSLSSSFVMRVPTSPLVNALNNPYLDPSAEPDLPQASKTDLKGRRRTMPPNSLQSYSTLSLEATSSELSRPLPTPLRRESSFPFQGHQPRRSIGSFTLQPSPGFQTPMSQSRRPSLASEASPKRRTSMIGSFEESILRGRMSSPASKPFDFIAQIGVMGKGDCPANLRCPAHVSVPFQAVFYSYPSSQAARSIADDAPSPYVGTIDLEHNLKSVQLATKQRRRATVCVGTDAEALLSGSDPTAPENTPIGKALARDTHLGQLKQSPQPAPKLNLGGAYRIPQQGQLQIIIKNSNKLAVKLFLVPYDLHDMEPGTKTFIRQRSFSTGPITEGALSDKSQNPNFFDPLKDKHILRYLIHIKFCCPSKGKFYLYDNIRVVFANRIPDGKEKLRNEVQLPEPKYSTWKATKAPQRTMSSSTIEFSPLESSPQQASSPGLFDDLRMTKLREPESIAEEAPIAAESIVPIRLPELPKRIKAPISNNGRRDTPFAFPDMPVKDELPKQPEQIVSPVQGFFASTSPRASPIPWSGSSSSSARTFSPVPLEVGSGLLSRQFRELRSLSTDDDDSNEIVMGARAATTSLTKILSQDDDKTLQEKVEQEHT